MADKLHLLGPPGTWPRAPAPLPEAVAGPAGRVRASRSRTGDAPSPWAAATFLVLLALGLALHSIATMEIHIDLDGLEDLPGAFVVMCR